MALKQLIALTDIQRVKRPGVAANPDKGIGRKPPVTETLKAGTVFKAKDEEQQEEFVETLRCAKEYDPKSDASLVEAKAAGTVDTDNVVQDENSDGLEGLRAEYKQVVGKNPAKNLKEETMREHIAKAEADAKDAEDVV